MMLDRTSQVKSLHGECRAKTLCNLSRVFRTWRQLQSTEEIAITHQEQIKSNGLIYRSQSNQSREGELLPTDEYGDWVKRESSDCAIAGYKYKYKETEWDP
jgi:hypothetical protein